MRHSHSLTIAVDSAVADGSLFLADGEPREFLLQLRQHPRRGGRGRRCGGGGGRGRGCGGGSSGRCRSHREISGRRASVRRERPSVRPEGACERRSGCVKSERAIAAARGFPAGDTQLAWKIDGEEGFASSPLALRLSWIRKCNLQNRRYWVS